MNDPNADMSIDTRSPKPDGTKRNNRDLSILLRDFEDMQVYDKDYTSSGFGFTPEKRPIDYYINSGVINVDKPANPSSHEVVSWVKRIFELEKTGHSGTLDPKVTGCLIVCLNKATRLVKSQQNAGKEYVCILRTHEPLVGGEDAFRRAVERLRGAIFQRPPVISAVKRNLRVRTIHESAVLEYDEKKNMGVFWVSCEAGTYIRTLCVHLGLMLGVGAHMEELRRNRSGAVSEKEKMFTLHEVRDAMTDYKVNQDEAGLRTVVQPLECLLVGHKRIMIKDSTVAAIAHGAKLTQKGIIRFGTLPMPLTLLSFANTPTTYASIDKDEEIVLITTKGEAVALAYSMITFHDLMTKNHGDVAKVKRNIMDRELYPVQWGLGPHALLKKKMIANGTLDKYGRSKKDGSSVIIAESTSTAVGDPMPENDTVPAFGEVPMPTKKILETKMVEVPVEGAQAGKTDKKRPNETPEERAERKRVKSEKKEQRAKERAEKEAKRAAKQAKQAALEKNLFDSAKDTGERF